MGHKKSPLPTCLKAIKAVKWLFSEPIVELQQCTPIFQNITDNF